MDILNFIYWIKNRRVLSKAPAGSLVPIGVKDPRRDDKYISCVVPVESLGGGGPTEVTTGKYRFSEFPDTIIPKTVFNESTVGKYFDANSFNPLNAPFPFLDTLEDGTIVSVVYNQSVLKSGVMIFEAYEIQTFPFPIGYINGWWIAYKQDPTDETKLIKCGEVRMTQQFWDNWYNWTAKDSGDNVVKFIQTIYPYDEFVNLETFTTTITYTGTGLTAVDSYFNYGGATVGSLYRDLTGLTPLDMSIQYYSPDWILDDDYYGMAMSAEAGWFYYRNYNAEGYGNSWYIVGFNLLTGATKAFNIVPALTTLTNWTFVMPGIEEKAPVQLINHPNGIFVSLDDGRLCDNGDNYDGVTAIWSPYWSGANTEVIYLGVRNLDNGYREFLRGNISGSITYVPWYWDNVALYFITYSSYISRDNGYICYKYNTNTKETTLYDVPYLPGLFNLNDSINGSINMWANNNGMFIDRYAQSDSGTMSTMLYQYFKHEDSVLYSFHLDTDYPTNAFDDKIYNINTFATKNMNTLGVPISTYKNMKF